MKEPGPGTGSAEPSGPGLEARIERLERILAALESERLELNEALALFEEGVSHVREAERLLARTELQIERLIAGPDGPSFEPVPPE